MQTPAHVMHHCTGRWWGCWWGLQHAARDSSHHLRGVAVAGVQGLRWGVCGLLWSGVG